MAGTGVTSVRSYSLYVESVTPAAGAFSALTIPFVDQVDSTPFRSMGVIIKNDNALGGNYIEFSFDGTTVQGKLKATEDITFDYKRETKIYLRSPGASGFRLWCW